VQIINLHLNQKKMKILIIEDNMGIAELISERLNDDGYTTHIAQNGHEALEFVSREIPDVIILDFSLPDVDGKTLVGRLSEKLGVLPPFIVSTGRGDEQVAVDMMKLGAYDYLIKDPYLLNRLPEVLMKLKNEINTMKRLREAEMALKQSEERFRSFVENSSDLFVKVSSEGKYVYVSPNSKYLLGYEPHEIIGKTFDDFLLPEHLSAVMSEFSRIINNESNAGAVEYSIMHKDGSIRHHAVRGVTVRENGEVFVNCIARDITEKKLADQTLQNAIIQTEEDERKRFADDLHEGIGPSLSALKFYMERIKNISGLSDKEKSAVDMCYNLVDDSVNQVRKISNKLKPGILYDFGLFKAIKLMVDSYNSSGTCTFELLINTFEPSEKDQITEIILYRGIEELIENTLKHSNADQARIVLEQKGNMLAINYSDNGDGFTVSGLRKSTGLTKLKSRVNSLGGGVEINSTKSKGVSVKILIKYF
jgi:PAS domain S-box-containing protein